MAFIPYAPKMQAKLPSCTQSASVTGYQNSSYHYPCARTTPSPLFHSAVHRVGGFTLIELMLVLVLIGIGTALGAAAVDRLAGRVTELHTLDQVQQNLIRLRNKAVLGRAVVEALVDFEHQRFALVTPAPTPSSTRSSLATLPEGYSWAPLPAVQRSGPLTLREPTTASLLLRFYPDGTTDSAQFMVVTPSGSEQIFRIAGVTGRIDRQARIGSGG